MDRCRCLGNYVETAAARQRLRIDVLHRPFSNGNAKDPPLLRGGQSINYILLYPGSFNPPHQGHMALLNYVLYNAGPDVHLVAAIIVLTDDNRLADKNSRDEQPLLLDKSARASLWRQADICEERVWVFDGPEESWARLRAELQRSLAREGVKLRFMLLVGPDLVNTRALTDPKAWGCIEAVTSDISRPVDFRCPNSLRQLPGCSLWEPSSSSAGGGCAITAVCGPPGGVSTCQTLRKPLRRYRFVPCQLGNTTGGEPPSSTELRRIIATCPREHLYAQLEQIALGPSLLVRYVLQGGPYTVPASHEQPADTESRKAKMAAHVLW